MGKIGIHLKDVPIALPESPPESVNIGCPQAQFSFSFFQEELTRILPLKRADNIRCTVRRIVIYYEDMKIIPESEYVFDDLSDVLFFAVGGYDNQFFQDRMIDSGTCPGLPGLGPSSKLRILRSCFFQQGTIQNF